MNIELLVQRAREGDVEALGELLAQYRKYLVFMARSQLHQRLQVKVDPSDLAQEVCLEAHRHVAEFRGQTAEQFAAWLRGILSNVLTTQIRKFQGTKKRDAHLEQSIDLGLANASGCLQSGLIADATSASRHLAREESILRLAEALESLPADYRQVIVLRHIDELPFAEVAQAMQRSVDSVEKLWVRALAKLKQTIGDSDA